jgi:LuxR family transcriptional regulator, maltose regulon positive regulatory protein
MTTLILTTKLYIPPPRPDIVSRSRLLKQLNTGLSRKLTLISAPAGFGKSTVLSTWVQKIETGARVAWLSLDEGDNDLSRFLTYFVTALQPIESNIGQGVLVALQSPGPVNIEILLTNLLNEIAQLPEHLILVLDDYHVIETPPIDQAIRFLLDHLPPQFHLIIASRIDPTLSLSRLRARGQLTELRASDLRFTPDEAAELLNQIMGLDLTPQDVEALEARTEGWVAGLHLAAISMQGLKQRTAITDFVNRFTGSDRYIQDYLADEVLKQQAEDVKDFLLQTSILNRLNASLCASVTQMDNAQKTLEQLENANLFIVPLDNERNWYRYHHLFADLLRHYLMMTFPDLIAELHRRASKWYQYEGYVDEAIQHAQAAGNTDQIADILENYWQIIIHRGELTKLKQLLDSLGTEITRKSAPLSMAYCWIHSLTGTIDPIPNSIQDIRVIWKESDPTENVKQPIQFAVIPSLVETMEAVVALDDGQAEKAKNHALRAISLIPDDPNPATRGLLHGAAGYRLAQAHNELGEYEQSCALLLEMLEMLKASQNYIGVATTIHQIVNIYQQSSKSQKAIALCEDTLGYFQEHGGGKMPPIGMVNLILAGLHADKGNFDAARKNLEIGREIVKPIKGPNISSLEKSVQDKLKIGLPKSQIPVEPLSERELDVLRLVAQGLTNREISERLYLAVDTVKGHNRRLFGKLDVQNRTEAVARARELEIL